MLVNLQNSEGETALHYAAEVSKKQAHHEFEDTDIIKTILDYGGYTNVKTKLTQETPMHYCARAGNADVLLEMVKHIEPNKVQNVINQQAKNGWSSLLVACEQGHLEILRILLKNHARVDVFDEHGNAALHLAAENGHEKVADLLLKHKAFVNAKSKLGVTPLHMAAQNGFNNFVKLLIQTHGAATDALSLAKKTPLHMAAQYGRISVCSTLLKMKADANATDVHGQTPLHLAGENDHSDVVKLFLKHQPDLVTMACTNGMTCAHVSACKGSVAVIKELMRFNKVIVITARNRTNDSTSLHLAAAGGHPELVRFLLDAGASATDENADGMTAIHLAARFGHIQVVHALQGKVSYNVTSSKTGLTALHVAAQHGQMDFVREMLSEVPATIRSEPPHHGDVRDTAAEHGLTPLHLASQSGHEGLVRLLLNSPGVQADAPTAVLGVIPLHMAAQNGHTAVVSLLLSKSTNQLHVKDKRGRTGLLLAAANGHINMVSLLLGQGAEINGYDRNGWTALHHSAKAGHLDVVTLLVEAGALPDHETKEDKVPICYAASSNHAEVLSYLMKKDHDTQHLMDNDKFVFDLMHNGKMSDNRSIKEFVLTSPAPVDTAVKLSQHFRLLAVREKERAKDLVAAGDFCETMATELMAIAASTSSASSLLKSVDSRGIPLLDVLIECEQKEVMSHAAVQKYLSEVWTGQLSHWAGWKMMVLFIAMLFVPIVWLFLSLPIKHRFNKVPVIKFMSYLVSHIYLIALFILTTVYPLYPIWESTNLLPHWYEWLLLAWLSGLVVSQLTNPEDRAGLGWIKVIIIALCAIATSVQVVAFLLPDDDRMTCLYIRNQLFGLSLTLCFIQLLDFLSFHYLFGPWAIIIRDLMKDLIRFLVILCIFMLGFTLQLAAIYRPMKPPSPFDLALGTGDGGGGAPIETPLDTFELLFFALFGLVEPENLPPVNRHPMWTVTLVKGVFAGYLIITLIVLINLLIAMMSDTYQRIQAQSDTEWKFGRAKLFRNMNRTSATPSPMNLLTKLFTYCKIFIKHRGKVCRMDAQKYVDQEEDLDDGAADSQSMDHSGSHGNWIQRRRNTAVVPESGFLHAAPKHHGPIKVEDVVDWVKVIKKYQALQGVGDALDTADTQDDGGATDTLNEINENKEDGAAT
ncbi:hypothetical protein NP493_214g02024 [Ridgeia piscesae]|uniref:Uncharacterized protein n=1 Tax=Ridgeia piscesae TaxID=27915 RepID=A0AAD9UE58_RIDPI|nr:hypothetical protein NP493_214g02024 [Ridgeia piscesae]